MISTRDLPNAPLTGVPGDAEAVLILGDNHLIGGAVVSDGILTGCWSVSDFQSDHWVHLVGQTLAAVPVKLDAEEAVRGAIDRVGRVAVAEARSYRDRQAGTLDAVKVLAQTLKDA